ncbi:MAG: M20/M25/M40 family metallo-hydrolase [Acidimicrobiia bacterium]
MGSNLVGETTELLQQMIRNRCVNDGTPDSGDELRSADLLQHVLEGAGLDVERFTARGDRTSVVARIEGSDPDAPTLCLMGHTDVVPVNPDGWHEDPFGGDLIDGEVWGRGAIDMLNLTASMAVAFRHLARSNFRPKGTLIFFGVADEEAGGTLGARWMADNHWDAIKADYVLTESGGWTVGASGEVAQRSVALTVAEKGVGWRKLKVRGTPSHGSMPYNTDNALVTAAEIVRRLHAYRPQARIDDIWKANVSAMNIPNELKARLLDPSSVYDAIGELPNPNLARRCHAMTHTTFSPNVAHGGSKVNTIPDLVELDVDIRTLPGEHHQDVEEHLRAALGELYDAVEITPLFDDAASRSAQDNVLYDALRRQTQIAFPGAELVPGMMVGGTDARFYREKGAIAFGAGLFSPQITFESFGQRFHGHDERIDVESLGLSTDLWLGVAHDVLG